MRTTGRSYRRSCASAAASAFTSALSTAIKIIGLPDELKEDIVHQYGENAFRLYRLPVPKTWPGHRHPWSERHRQVARRSSCSPERSSPTWARFDNPPSKEEVLAHFAGTELHDYLIKVYRQEGSETSMKPQYVDKLPDGVQGTGRATC